MTLISLVLVLLLAPALSIAEPPCPVDTHSPEAVAFVDVQTATPIRLAEFGITSPHARLEARDAALAALPPDKTEIARSRPMYAVSAYGTDIALVKRRVFVHPNLRSRDETETSRTAIVVRTDHS